jgi:amino acid transporter
MTTGSEPLVVPARPGVFSRKATGLVREASAWDVFAYNVNMQNWVIGIIFMLQLIPPFYPGANIYLATLIALVISLPVSYIYAKLGGVFPRSGGDYVFVSRIIHPALGFMSNLSYCIWAAFYVGVGGVFLGLYGIAPILRVLGAYSQNKALVDAGNWFADPTGKFIMAVGLLAVFTAIFIFGGLRAYFRVQSTSFILASIGIALMALWALVASHTSAMTHLDTAVRNIGGKPLSPLARGSGSAPFSWKETIYAAIWPWLAFNSAITSTYMGGEIKRADRSQVLGIMGSLLWAGAWVLFVTWGMLHVFGTTFFANLGNADPTKYGLSSIPTFGELTAYAVGQAVIGLVLMIGFALWTYVWVGPYTVLLTRSMLAWSLDRLGPAKLAEVNERFHSPVYALLTIFGLGIITSWLYASGKLSVLTGTVGLTASMMVVALAGILLPYTKRTLWEASPAYGYTVGVPTITLIGIIAMPLLILIQWALLSDPNSGTSISGSPDVLKWVAIIFVVGLPLYFIIRAVQKSRGINVDLAYKEIPPE